MENQLNLFDYFNESVSKGLELLARLNFTDARKAWSEVLNQDNSDIEALRAIQLISYWQNTIECCCRLSNIESLNYLHKEIAQFHFIHSAPDKIIFNALSELRVNLMFKAEQFELESGIDIVDLAEGLYKETDVILYLKKIIGTDLSLSKITSRLADVLYATGEYEQAKKYYSIALLANHSEINADKIIYEDLKNIIHRHGSEMACAYAYIEGKLPLPDIRVAENLKCLKVCQLVQEENRTDISKNYHKLLALRKQIKELDEEFFCFFMTRKSFLAMQ